MESISEGNSIIPSIPDINDTSAALLGIALGNENIVPLSIFIDTNTAMSAFVPETPDMQSEMIH
ncbi:hypothetical protein N7516_004162 [Penicillium verrucosum]|uniref:uncharacterized protein n=1 Tax=Penicillium verrucosum TaxID=60171 RepID=UPI00254503F9|nr:uncharacterized protein N7516_004162 [Penicillium verrucosum]KAJ5943994.1 hypothetical protein N7516_004162 [Penicillium verrucosum]